MLPKVKSVTTIEYKPEAIADLLRKYLNLPNAKVYFDVMDVSNEWRDAPCYDLTAIRVVNETVEQTTNEDN